MKSSRYEIVGGPLDGMYRSTNSSADIKSAGAMWETHSRAVILACINMDNFEFEEEHIYRLAKCRKNKKRYWAYVGTDASQLEETRPRIKLSP